jgi:Domain of unknown function (DUF4338)
VQSTALGFALGGHEFRESMLKIPHHWIWGIPVAYFVYVGLVAMTVLNQRRFLLLPSVGVKGLASKILAQGARYLPADWERRYGYRPLLLETLVDAQRFRGTCYRAANRIHVGQTQGRGRMDREHREAGLAAKGICLYPLRRDVQRELCRNTPRDRS